MAADWWARGIAIGGAAAASLNMTVSALNYRRARPKVQVLVESAYLDVISKADTKPNAISFRLRFTNKGSTAIGIETLSFNSPREANHAHFGGIQAFATPLELKPFSGLTHLNVIPFTAVTRGTIWLATEIEFRIRLTDGRQAKSAIFTKIPSPSNYSKPQ